MNRPCWFCSAAAKPGWPGPLERRTITIGRNPDCDIVLNDRQVSRVHARITWHEDHYEVEDLASKNGTHLNGRDVAGPQALHDGDEIQIALVYKLAFVDAGATAPLVFEKPAPEGLRTGRDDAPGVDQWQTAGAAAVGAAVPPARAVVQHPGITTRDEIVRAVWSDAAEIGRLGAIDRCVGTPPA